MRRVARPVLHVAPRTGWLNDPNGPIEWDGRFHVFFQHNPLAAAWAPRVHWGHAVSDDLCSWELWPDALVPADAGPDSGGCWSGCVVDDGGVPTAVYSGLGERGEAAESVCVARGDPALRTWRKDPANPVLAGPPDPRMTAFRDPFVWREDGGWRMVIGAGMPEGDGAVLAYRSRDLLSWQPDGVLVRGLEGTICECPQYFTLGGRRVLLASVAEDAPSHVLALVGDEVEGRFLAERTERFDHGPVAYAPATMLDSSGRRLAWLWAREASDAVAGAVAGALTFPRVLTLGEDGALRIAPAPEQRRLRGEPAVDGDRLEVVAALRPSGGLRIGGAAIRWDGAELRVGGSRAAVGSRAGETLRLHAFLDGDLLELYADERLAFTERVGPGGGVHAEGARPAELRSWRLAAPRGRCAGAPRWCGC